MTSILIVDDHVPFRARARALLEGDGFVVVGEAGDAAAALHAARRLRPDVVLLDIGLPDRTGFDLADELAHDRPALPVILTSSRDASAYGPRLAASLARGFIPKDELTGAAVRALAGCP